MSSEPADATEYTANSYQPIRMKWATENGTLISSSNCPIYEKIVMVAYERRGAIRLSMITIT